MMVAKTEGDWRPRTIVESGCWVTASERVEIQLMSFVYDKN